MAPDNTQKASFDSWIGVTYSPNEPGPSSLSAYWCDSVYFWLVSGVTMLNLGLITFRRFARPASYLRVSCVHGTN